MIFQDWKTRLTLERKLRQIKKEFEPKFSAARTSQEHQDARRQFDTAAAKTLSDLGQLKTNRLTTAAKRYGIDVPKFDYNQNLADTYWDEN